MERDGHAVSCRTLGRRVARLEQRDRQFVDLDNALEFVKQALRLVVAVGNLPKRSEEHRAVWRAKHGPGRRLQIAMIDPSASGSRYAPSAHSFQALTKTSR